MRYISENVLKKNHVLIDYNGEKYLTLKDILPEKPTLNILFVGKRPIIKPSVKLGHYLQGNKGKYFWNRIQEYGHFEVAKGKYEDECLLKHCYGMTDIVKVPGRAGDEPSDKEYCDGIPKILQLIQTYKPKIVVFLYKEVLDKILSLHFYLNLQTCYGFNDDLKKIFGTAIFVWPNSRIHKNVQENTLEEFQKRTAKLLCILEK